MGTRSLTVFVDVGEKKKKTEIGVMYRHWDGYPQGMGQDLFEILKGYTITNGIPIGGNNWKLANGMGCLACQLIARMKDGPGNIYLYPAGTRDVGEQYIYTLRNTPETTDLILKVESCFGKRKVKLFKGLFCDFDSDVVEAKDRALWETPAPKRKRKKSQNKS